MKGVKEAKAAANFTHFTHFTFFTSSSALRIIAAAGWALRACPALRGLAAALA